jgi:hypothetical protein
MVFGLVILCSGMVISPTLVISHNRDDTTPPVTTATFDPPEPNNNGWYNTFVQVTLNATDNESGVWKTYCSLLPPGEVYTEPIRIYRDGIYYIYFCSIDYAGNVEIPKSVGIKIDKTPPLVILSWTWQKVGSVYNIILSVKCYDAMSGLCGIVDIYFNGVLQETVTGPGPDYVWAYQYAPLPNFTIKIVTYDIAGNIGEVEIINPHSIPSPSNPNVQKNTNLNYNLLNNLILQYKIFSKAFSKL